MKHIHTLLMTVVLSTSVTAAADELAAPPPEARKNILSVSVMPLFQNGLLEVSGERVVAPRVSVGLGLRAGVLHSDSRSELVGIPNTAQEAEQSSYLLRVEPMARIFLTGTAPEGLWMSPRLSLSRSWSKSGSGGLMTSYDTRAWDVGGAALLGYSAVVGKGLAVQFGGGLEALYSDNRTTMRGPSLGSDAGIITTEFKNRSWSLRERVEVSVGWAF